MKYITKKYKFIVGTGYVGSDQEEIIEVNFTEEEYEDEDIREEVIEKEYREWVSEQLDGGWEEIEN